MKVTLFGIGTESVIIANYMVAWTNNCIGLKLAKKTKKHLVLFQNQAFHIIQ